MSSGRPFKKFFCDRPEVFLLPPAALKIWLYHYSREGLARQSWSGIETLCEKLDMDRHSVCKWRGWLVANGWMERIGERQGSGKFSVPVFKVKRGSIPVKNRDGRASNRVRKLCTRTTGVKTLHADRCENFALEVDVKKQVDKESGGALPIVGSEMEERIWNIYLERVKPGSTYSFLPSRKEMLTLRYREMISAGNTPHEARTHLVEAIFALAADDYHMGRKRKYEGRFQNDFKDVFGTQEVFEKWCTIYQANEKAGRV